MFEMTLRASGRRKCVEIAHTTTVVAIQFVPPSHSALCDSAELYDRKVVAVGRVPEVEIEENTWTSPDERMRSSTRRTTRPSRARFVPRTTRGPSMEVDLIGSSRGDAFVRALRWFELRCTWTPPAPLSRTHSLVCSQLTFTWGSTSISKDKIRFAISNDAYAAWWGRISKHRGHRRLAL